MPLVSASTLREYLPEITGTDADTELNNLILRVESSIARYLGFVPPDSVTNAVLDSSTYTVFLDGPFKNLKDVLQLPMKPAVSVTSIHSDPDLVYGSSTSIDGSQYVLDKENARIVLKSTSTDLFDTGFRYIKVVYVAGFDNTDPPEDLVHAICLLCSNIQRSKQGQGYSNINARSVTVGFVPRTAFPTEIKQLLAGYRNAGSIF